MWKNKKVTVFITGGIAAFKAATLVRMFVKEGAKVSVAMTKSACEFITPLTFQVLTKNKVYLDTFDEDEANKVQHIHLADQTDVAIVVPATANTIAKMANGIADNFVTSTLLATTTPIYVVPAMNEHMWENPATVRNVKQLVEDGKSVIEPATGFLAEGYDGKGRLPEPEEIFEQVTFFESRREYKSPLEGKTILITAGGTKERIDPVRYISNDSSGKMGYALARAAAVLGAEVQLISTTKQLKVPYGVQVTYVESALEMHDVVTHLFPKTDIAVMVAAVSDYYVANRSNQKIKKQQNELGLTLELLENPDILKKLGHSKREEQIVIGFAAETTNVLEYAKAKLEKKKADVIIANDVSNSRIGFNSDSHQVTLLTKDGHIVNLPENSKEELALNIWESLLEEKIIH
ncbi:bifunctional phosphopantothenoylcysteine decarboxylase/phosphopantothenate--cysteine ligase CoaBC [Granulicatella sp. HMSC31F03]|uniref:bifunctional phosphopantothenoylcysteine decarboxylase/phosphopantothenate--cysteine ligase CoaBC n=1 Tax=Granulicatella sp. HMSC31F03 TaxID=1581074 RepID=UPI0008A50A8D|nr:bifunctional phosphopantothenoylcysteine decarboxylase/phosphopantothenate--cysteine ligase CoaBC [Granulicatella sp. HMSC31F03]OFT01107.1 phosphopantothenoylcysteine decarboxylase [Granulicatella sp. HMSC31F03]